MPEDTQTPDNIAPIDAPAEEKRQTLQEVIDSIDVTNISPQEVILDLVRRIQELGNASVIALGLLGKIEAQQQAANEKGDTAEDA
jgi:hypothetical protein